MNLKAIRTLRKKFILMSTATYLLVMLFMGASINFINSASTRRQIRAVLSYLLDNADNQPGDDPGAGFPPEESAPEEQEGLGSLLRDLRDRENGEKYLLDFSPEFRSSARFFTVLYDEDGGILSADLDHISEISRNDAYDMADRAEASPIRYGRIGYYYYEKRSVDTDRTIVAFLNCRSQISTNTRILTNTVLITAAGLLIAFVFVFFFSNRVIAPEIENARRQKQFITNASHELKTPLAVIRANTEIEEMMNGSSEWTQSTMRQVDRLSGLVANLVMIARAQEREDRSVMEEIDVSRGVDEMVRPYESLAQQDKKTLEISIVPDVRMTADESKIRQLTSLLIDNAFKYCDDQGTVRVKLEPLRKGKTVRLTVSNTYKNGANIDYGRFFDRFYREDSSHNTERGGYGIGLSIAESICQQYGGSISASWKDGEISFVCLLISG